jgi:protein-disulfide isomerase
MRTIIRATLLSAIMLAVSVVANATEFNDTQRQEMGAIIKDYLLNHPELLREMAQTLEQKQKQAEDEQRKSELAEYADQIFRDKSDFVAGNPKGNVTIVEFFDYNCPWCKKAFPDMMALIDVDPELKLVLKEFPILGPESEYASQAAIAAGKQGKYLQMHKAMYLHEGRMTKNTVDTIASDQGLDMARLKKDMDDAATTDVIARNRHLGELLAIGGTPAFVIDDKLVPGYLPRDQLANAVKEVRTKGGCSLC